MTCLLSHFPCRFDAIIWHQSTEEPEICTCLLAICLALRQVRSRDNKSVSSSSSSSYYYYYYYPLASSSSSSLLCFSCCYVIFERKQNERGEMGQYAKKKKQHFPCKDNMCQILLINKYTPNNFFTKEFIFVNDPWDLGSISGRVIPKTQKMVSDTALLNTQHYKVRIKGKVEQSRE